MKTISLNIYLFTELSEKAQAKAHEHYLYDIYYDDTDAQNVLEKFCQVFGIGIYDWCCSSCGFSYTKPIFKDEYVEENLRKLSGVRLSTYIYNKFSSILFKGRYYSKWVGTDLKQRRSKVLLECDWNLTGYFLDGAILEPIYKFLQHPQSNITFEQLLDLCLVSFFSAYKSDIENIESLEYFRDLCADNENYFYEDGTLI